ncbi:MAG: tetratricopeptide repeat protein [Planctomycetes bacterium]|nr:tetratricopeptide repeat protein [Planctomycetota bacterium]
MTTSNPIPLIDRLYLRYLDEESSANFVASVSRHYLTSTLERLAVVGQRLSRRGAVLALGFLGSYESNATLGRALKDGDRIVRILAENSIREVWCRDGSETQRQQLAILVRLNHGYQFEEALEIASLLIQQAPRFAEAWNQRAIAHYRLGQFEAAANDCQQTLELNPCHFGAIVGMAHCYLEMGEGFAALECFRRAVEVHPGLEAVRGQIEFLERALEEI